MNRMSKMSRRTPRIAKRTWLPPWDMPSDPIKAVWWFMHWLLKVVVRYFWVAIFGMLIYETYLNWRTSGPFNGIVAGVITLIIGLVVWGILYLVLLAANVSTTISHTIDNVSQMQRTFSERRPPYPFTTTDPFRARSYEHEQPEDEENIVEGTITDLEEERRKRRRE